MIDEQPRRGIRDSLVAFVHPASTGGVLTELVQPAAGAPLMARDSGDMRRVEVGFSGGQVILMRIPEKAYEQLRAAVQDGRSWYDVETADGVVAVNLTRSCS